MTYAETLGIAPTTLSSEHVKLRGLPQHFADMFGWPEMAETVELDLVVDHDDTGVDGGEGLDRVEAEDADVGEAAHRPAVVGGPEGVGGYRRKCDEVAAKGYEGFELA